MTNRLMPEHLQRRAIVYVRQSTIIQVRQNRESQIRQYNLAGYARELWALWKWKPSMGAPAQA